MSPDLNYILIAHKIQKVRGYMEYIKVQRMYGINVNVDTCTVIVFLGLPTFLRRRVRHFQPKQ